MSFEPGEWVTDGSLPEEERKPMLVLHIETSPPTEYILYDGLDDEGKWRPIYLSEAVPEYPDDDTVVMCAFQRALDWEYGDSWWDWDIGELWEEVKYTKGLRYAYHESRLLPHETPKLRPDGD